MQAEDDQNVNMPRDTEQDIQNDQIEEEYDRVIENEVSTLNLTCIYTMLWKNISTTIKISKHF